MITSYTIREFLYLCVETENNTFITGTTQYKNDSNLCLEVKSREPVKLSTKNSEGLYSSPQCHYQGISVLVRIKRGRQHDHLRTPQ